jgi:hypothetical protein
MPQETQFPKVVVVLGFVFYNLFDFLFGKEFRHLNFLPSLFPPPDDSVHFMDERWNKLYYYYLYLKLQGVF